MRNEVTYVDDDTSAIVVVRNNGDRFEVFVDTADVNVLHANCNTVHVDNYRGVFYAKAWTKDGERVWLHRYLINPPDDLVVDHINRNPLDNRRRNLRAVTKGENNRNAGTPRTNTSGFKWVSFQKDAGKYRGRFTYHGKKYSAGLFDSPEEAYQAVVNERKSICS